VAVAALSLFDDGDTAAILPAVELIGSLADGASTSFNYLLSLKSETIDFRPTARVPLPAYVLLLMFMSFIAIAKISRTATTTIKQ